MSDAETLQSECTAWPNAFQSLKSNWKKIPLSSPPPQGLPLCSPSIPLTFAPLLPSPHWKSHLNNPRLNTPPHTHTWTHIPPYLNPHTPPPPPRTWTHIPPTWTHMPPTWIHPHLNPPSWIIMDEKRIFFLPRKIVIL